MKLIDANALADALFEKRRNYPQWVADTIGAMPDAIVRCKDCAECYFASNRVQSEQTFACGKHGIDVTPDWFCADGVKQE